MINSSRRACGRAFVPSLQVLEDRSCPAVTANQFHGTLMVVGDAANDAPIVQYNGANGNTYVDVNGDGDFSDSGDKLFTNVQQVLINLDAGNDNLQFNLISSLNRSLDLQIDLGDGVNNLNLNLGAGISPPLGEAQIVVRGGQNADVVTTSLGGIAGRLALDYQLGNGRNVLDLNANSFITGGTSIRLETGFQDDTFNANFAGALDCSAAGESFSLSAKMGGGRDRVSAGFQDVYSAAELGLDMGAHNDRVALAFRNVSCTTPQSNTRLSVNVALGGGDDDFGGTINGVISDDGFAAAAHFVVLTGEGDDVASLIANSNIGRPPRGGALAVWFNGNDGDDIFKVRYRGLQGTYQGTGQGGKLTRESSLRLRLDGGLGKDEIDVILDRVQRAGRPRIDVRVYGGPDVDAVNFILKDRGEIRGDQFIDGGTGKDEINAVGIQVRRQ